MSKNRPDMRAGAVGRGSGASVRCRWGVFAALLIAMLAWVAPTARAQDSGTSLGTKAVGIKLDVDSTGTGGLVRAGSLVGVRVRITDAAVSRRNVAVRMVLRDSDGDYYAPARVVPLTPGVAQPVWVYAWLPPRTDDQISLGVYPIEGDGGLEAIQIDQPLARVELSSTTTVAGRQMAYSDAAAPFILRVGSPALGLQRYAQAAATVSSSFTQERFQVLEARTPAELPDNVMGLQSIGTVVWGAGEPRELKGAYAQAMRQWILGGGHLVIVLPAAGQRWLGSGLDQHEFQDLMPEVDVVSRDGVDLSPYVPLLTRSTARLPASAMKGVVNELKARDGVSPEKATPILVGESGEWLVVRRNCGAGAVTVIGLDLARQNSIQVDADIFWHRVLGTRGQLLNATEMANVLTGTGRSTRILDDGFTTETGTQRSMSSVGVLMGLVVFALYWIMAGPGSFAVLRKTKRTHLSWLAFTAMAGIFTLVSWGGAWALKPSETNATHLTLYEHVHGQPITRSRTWLSVMLPWYGDATVSVGGVDGKLETGPKREFRNVVAPWSAGGSTGDASFPDTRDYVQDVTNPSSLRFPTRSTVKSLQAEWTGGTLLRTPEPLKESNELGGEIKLQDETLGNGQTRRLLTGRLRHELPADLVNVDVWYIPGQRPILKAAADGRMPSDRVREGAYALSEGMGGWVFSRSEPWKAGETLDLRKIAESTTPKATLSVTLQDLVFQPQQMMFSPVNETAISMRSRFMLLTAMGQLASPFIVDNKVNDVDRMIVQRKITHGWDASRWFTQPCVIITGELVGETPTPVYIDGERMKTSGSTWIRWIYPLDAAPPRWRSPGGGPDQAPTSGSTPVEGPN